MAEDSKSPVAKQLKKKQKKEKKRDRFIRTRMWVSTIVSSMFNDRGTIPPNIGNNILITNNLYITRNALSAVMTLQLDFAQIW